MLFRFSFAAVALFVFLTGYSAPSYALPDEAPAADTERDEYDFSWLDPEKKIYVVQNRKYTKASRLEISTSYGVGMGETYRTQRTWAVRGIFYLSEHFGVSGFMLNNNNTENDTLVQIKQVANRAPEVRDTNKYYGGSVMWLPFYGKLNMFNQIFYLDWHFEAGIGSANTELDINTSVNGAPIIVNDTFSAFHWGSGLKFFITRHWLARLDFLATYYKASNGLTTSSGSIAKEETYDNYYLTLGVGYTF